MLEMRNFLQKKINKKGFTLAELLVVVAIIAIIVAISIPIFTGKLNKAKENTDLANVRAAKAAAVTAYLQGDVKVDATSKKADMYYDAENGKVVKTAAEVAKGYNKADQGTVTEENKAIVKVTITETTPTGASESEPDVAADWVAKS